MMRISEIRPMCPGKEPFISMIHGQEMTTMRAKGRSEFSFLVSFYNA